MAGPIIFAKTDIGKELALIEKRYGVAYAVHSTANVKLMRLYSSMAIISLSGWLEDGMDEVTDLSLRGLSSDAQTRLLTKRDGVNGASYRHFVQRLEVAFGAHGVQDIEASITVRDKAILESTLGLLKKLRDDASHSHRVSIPRNPTQIISDFQKIQPILRKIEVAARRYRDKHFR